MPVSPTYPGVYIEELPSGVRTITGVATSITAFAGRALRGPVNQPVTIQSYADFERTFGGLWNQSAMSFAVRDFYQNGGAQAVAVRIFNQNDSNNGAAKLAVGDWNFTAANPGTWGKHLRVRVEHPNPQVVAGIAQAYGVNADQIFNIAFHDSATGTTEVFRNVTGVASPRQLDKVLANQSQLARVSGNVPNARPQKHPDPQPGENLWATNAPETNTLFDAAEANDGDPLVANDFTGPGKETAKEGLYALEKTDLFNLLCVPPFNANGDTEPAVITAAANYCLKRRAMLIVDPQAGWTTKDLAKTGMAGGVGTDTNNGKNAAIFFPRLRQTNPLRDNQMETFAPCGAVAGIFARTDSQRGVWKAPAGLDASLSGVPALSVPLTDAENGELNPLGLNCLRSLPAAGRVIWGSRTLVGDDRLGSEWKYVPVRRLALFIEESLYRGTQWVVFEPNDEPLWAQIRLNVGTFMSNLFRQGAFQGSSPREAYFVKCDKETTTQADINLGIVNIVVGFAPLKPAEFVVIKLQQMAGQLEA